MRYSIENNKVLHTLGTIGVILYLFGCNGEYTDVDITNQLNLNKASSSEAKTKFLIESMYVYYTDRVKARSLTPGNIAIDVDLRVYNLTGVTESIAFMSRVDRKESSLIGKLKNDTIFFRSGFVNDSIIIQPKESHVIRSGSVFFDFESLFATKKSNYKTDMIPVIEEISFEFLYFFEDSLGNEYIEKRIPVSYSKDIRVVLRDPN